MAYATVLVIWAGLFLVRLFVDDDQWPRPWIIHLSTVVALLGVSLIWFIYSHRLPRRRH